MKRSYTAFVIVLLILVGIIVHFTSSNTVASEKRIRAQYVLREPVEEAVDSLNHAIKVMKMSKDLNKDYDRIMDDIYDALAWIEKANDL